MDPLVLGALVASCTVLGLLPGRVPAVFGMRSPDLMPATRCGKLNSFALLGTAMFIIMGILPDAVMGLA